MTDATAERGRIAGVDFGAKRIGVAIADLEIGIATPHETYYRRSESADRDFFRSLAKEERLVRFVVGLPVHTDGRESSSSLAARQFGQWLERETSLPVVWFDERYTSSQAEELLSAARLSPKQRKERLDKLAAQIMLTAYLESTRSGLPPRALDA